MHRSDSSQPTFWLARFTRSIGYGRCPCWLPESESSIPIPIPMMNTLTPRSRLLALSGLIRWARPVVGLLVLIGAIALPVRSQPPSQPSTPPEQPAAPPITSPTPPTDAPAALTTDPPTEQQPTAPPSAGISDDAIRSVATPPDPPGRSPGLPALQAMLDRANLAILGAQPDLAADLYRQVISLAAPDNPQRVVAHLGLGSLLNNQGQMEQAIAQFDEAIKLAPNSAIGYALRGLAFYDLERWDESIASLRRAVELDPNNPQIRINLANSLYERQDNAGTIEQLRAAVELRPDLALYHYNLGMMLEEQGQTDEAIAHYQTAVEIDPADAEIRAALDRLRSRPTSIPDSGTRAPSRPDPDRPSAPQ